jgi:hypothetical protein
LKYPDSRISRCCPAHHELTLIFSKLLIGIEHLDAIDGTVRGDVDVHVLADLERSHGTALFVESKITDVVLGVVTQSHIASRASEKLHHHGNDKPPVLLDRTCLLA